MKKKVLFICAHNSARSQMAAALLNNRCGEYFEAKSAGLEQKMNETRHVRDKIDNQIRQFCAEHRSK
jgi:protein-tyrosine-phosphatase